jgi:hypothetical protein
MECHPMDLRFDNVNFYLLLRLSTSEKAQCRIFFLKPTIISHDYFLTLVSCTVSCYQVSFHYHLDPIDAEQNCK